MRAIAPRRRSFIRLAAVSPFDAEPRASVRSPPPAGRPAYWAPRDLMGVIHRHRAKLDLNLPT